jgi:arylformamidase
MFKIIDLTKVLDENLPIYKEDTYSDPPLQIETWCTVQEQGYRVSRLSMGTQTGTHIDAPSHFVVNGATLDALPLQSLMGRYQYIDVDQITQEKVKDLGLHWDKNVSILFLASSEHSKSRISEELFSALLELPCPVWVIIYGIHVIGHEPLYFHKALAKVGKYLIEDLDETMADQVEEDGELIALPMRLNNCTGSPCRVIVRQRVE